MRSETLGELKLIGEQLNQDRYPRFRNDGVIVPGDGAVQTQLPGLEMPHGNARQSPFSARPRKRTSGWQRTPGGTADSAAPLRVEQLAQQLEAQLDAVGTAYPDTKVIRQHHGAWLTYSSRIRNGLDRRARFFVAIPFSPSRLQAWGYWEGTVLQVKWIGPRHTNFPDGSICAFDPREPEPPGSHDLVGLFDIYTLWAFRHLHLELFGTWPGRQVGDFASERIFEFQQGELCGCARSARAYDACCRQDDQRTQNAADLVDFALTFNTRRPPDEVQSFAQGGEPPRIELLAVATSWSTTLN